MCRKCKVGKIMDGYMMEAKFFSPASGINMEQNYGLININLLQSSCSIIENYFREEYLINETTMLWHLNSHCAEIRVNSGCWIFLIVKILQILSPSCLAEVFRLWRQMQEENTACLG